MVTGAARGIGAACVTALAHHGWRVVGIDACETGADVGYPRPTRSELQDTMRRASPSSQAVVGDVRDQVELSDLFNQIAAEHGRLDAVVAAAGVIAGGPPLWQVETSEWHSLIETNLTGVFNTIRASLPHILNSPGPRRFVALASAAATLGLPRLGAYAAAKHAVVGLVRSLAADLAGHDATANVVSPGSTRGAILNASAAIYGLDSPEAFVRHQPSLGRLIEPSEVAALIRWLCSPESAAITGAVLAADGGMTATN